MSTVPNTPQSSTDNVVDDDCIFAWLKPFNSAARETFDSVVDAYISDQETHGHISGSLHFNLARDESVQTVSVFTNDSASDDELDSSRPNHRWTGGFKLSLGIPPRVPEEGWYVGTGCSRTTAGEIDILLAAPTKRWDSTGLAAKHGRIFFHKETCRLTLQARHSVILHSTNGPITIRRPDSRVLDHTQVVSFGERSYVFEYTDFAAIKHFEEALCLYMKAHHGSHWMPLGILSPSLQLIV